MLPATYSRHNQNWLPSLFNELFDDDFSFTPAKQFASPAVNVLENEKDFQIELAAPGMTKGDFSVRLENDKELSIKLEKKNEEKKEKKNYLRREFSYASYQLGVFQGAAPERPQRLLPFYFLCKWEFGLHTWTLSTRVNSPATTIPAASAKNPLKLQGTHS